MITKYVLCCSYLESKLYPCHNSWARYAISKVFTAGIESTQQVESINGVLKKHLDRDTLLKELVKAIKQELEKESYYTRIRDYYGSNPSLGLSSMYNTIFKRYRFNIKESFSTNSTITSTGPNESIIFEEPASIESNTEPDDIIEHLHNFTSTPSEINMHITITNITKSFTSASLHYFNQIQTASVYTSTIQDNINKKLQFGNTMSVAKTSVQVAMTEGIKAELIRILTQFISKYHCTTSLNIGTCNIQKNDQAENNPRGRPPKRLKLSIEEEATKPTHKQRTCSYCLNKRHDIRRCTQYKADMVNKEN
ncbi:27383_t:CDS:2 [Gigaspora margarita]|uniref:27383_t:CDS:1 n=1 Tax=Gigaspora margarita TaxID=4874 RepID=A0ABN7VHB7_GIGMA|nr:27383_t:CDS:2 [Gigaspora margarita]